MTHPFDAFFGINTSNPLEGLLGGTEVYRSADKVVVRADIPGVDPDAIDIEVENGVLSTSATRKPFEADGLQRVSRSIFSGPGEYSFTQRVGSAIDAEAITADYTAGVLTVTLPISEKAQARKVTVVSGQKS